ncbi:hypothetical protein CAPTEDRAFT_229371 [Capitella teleta]|uniref:Migration and invasion-inhibitory protein n=1 Tax=Capitella teleta TaxID=283909 RepID=R7USZ2_CAPTE|nr:hypothetical protein CAPTEDRAFT_229371 [Capitella teleta]|eukprot:ELU09604.1 hypothetical protein CAPTEDRAFT_229371 [Capitella teleta]
MEPHELQQLQALRLQNLSLLKRMHQGQERCHALVYGTGDSPGLLPHRTKPSLRVTLPSHDSEPLRNSEVEVKTYPSPSKRTPGKKDQYRAAFDTSGASTEDFSQCTTPPRTKDTALSKADTPKSILKHRKIIDDNVIVESKFVHTPNAGKEKKKKGLNFSYSDVDDLDLAMELNAQRTRNANKTGSYIEESLDTSVRDLDLDEDENLKMRTETQSKLLKDTGNCKGKKNIVTDFSRRSKSASAAAPSSGASLLHQLPAALDSRLQPPLLGYDWIAGNLDSEGDTLYNMPENYFDEIKNFRKQNKEDCLSNPYSSNPLGNTRPLSPIVQDPSHTCIHGYDINDRLFTQPVNADEDGRSICPICLVPRKDEASAQSPGFVRVSIPKSAIAEPYQRKPSRRGSFDSADSCALTKHCLAGWECSQPSMLPTATTLDLQQASKGIRAKQTATKDDADKLAKSFSRFSRLLGSEDADDSVSALREQSSTGDGVLNRSRALEWELRQAPRDPPYIMRR